MAIHEERVEEIWTRNRMIMMRFVVNRPLERIQPVTNESHLFFREYGLSMMDFTDISQRRWLLPYSHPDQGYSSPYAHSQHTPLHAFQIMKIQSSVLHSPKTLPSLSSRDNSSSIDGNSETEALFTGGEQQHLKIIPFMLHLLFFHSSSPSSTNTHSSSYHVSLPHPYYYLHPFTPK